MSDNTTRASSSESESVSGEGTPGLGDGARLTTRIPRSGRTRYSCALVDISGAVPSLPLREGGDRLVFSVLGDPLYVGENRGVKLLPANDGAARL